MNTDRSLVSRRLALVQFGAVGLTVGMLGRTAAHVSAQEATPDTRPPVLVAFEAAWNANDDGSQFASLLTPDVVWEDVPNGLLIHGPEACAEYYVQQIQATPDLKTQYTGFVAGNQAVAEWTNHGTYTGQFPGMPQGTGQPVAFRGVDIFTIDGDKLSRITTYYDLSSLHTQIGVTPACDEAATPAP